MFTLPASVNLVPETYWVSVQGEGVNVLGGERWFWDRTDLGVSNTQFNYENPLGGYANGCTSWMPYVNCGGDVADLSFALGGDLIPVELVSFDVLMNGSDVTLNWETASETNNAGFEVQMLQGDSWGALGFVEGHGTTTEAQSYAFTAGSMEPGTYAFRLKQIDFDGAFEYSGEVEATIEVVGTHVLSQAYPNPFNPQAQFTLAVASDQQVTATLYNVLGQQVAILFEGTVEANAQQRLTIDGTGLASGAYVVRIAGETFSDALRVTLAK